MDEIAFGGEVTGPCGCELFQIATGCEGREVGTRPLPIDGRIEWRQLGRDGVGAFFGGAPEGRRPADCDQKQHRRREGVNSHGRILGEPPIRASPGALEIGRNLVYWFAMEFGRHIEAAKAFLVLDMTDEALEELSCAGSAHGSDPELLELKATIFMRRKDWVSALRILEFLCRALPFSGDHFLHCAFCLHELKRTHEARKRLLSGPSTLRKSPLFHYNLACYEAQLGDLEASRLSLDRAILLDESFKAIALKDADLAPLKLEPGISEP